MDLQRTPIDRALGVDVAMECPARAPPIDELDAADFDDPMAGRSLEARRFRVQYYLAHGAIYRG
jgi:hypothetical protein